MEHRLSSAVLFTYPKSQDYETGDSHLKLATLKVPSGNILCAAVVPARFEANFKGDSLSGASTAFCFGREANILVLTLMNHTISNIYSSIEKFQNHNFARHIDIAYVGNKKIDAEMQDYQEIAADDPAFTPSPDAKEFRPEIQTIKTIQISSGPVPTGSDSGPVYISAGIAIGMLIKQVAPIYPLDAKAAHITGTVVIQAQIGKDGSIEDAKIVSSPNSSLAAAALDAVRQWRYRPYMLNGQPVAVATQINVIFTL